MKKKKCDGHVSEKRQRGREGGMAGGWGGGMTLTWKQNRIASIATRARNFGKAFCGGACVLAVELSASSS